MSTEVIDACVMINLLATGLDLELTMALERVWLMSALARQETLFLDSPPDDEGHRHRVPAAFTRLEQSDRLRVRTLDEGWREEFVLCAAQLPDADASSVALAAALKVPLATDDPKERRVARELFPALEVHSTLGLLFEGSSRLSLAPDQLREMAFNLRWRGNFLPPRRDPQSEWYARLSR